MSVFAGFEKWKNGLWFVVRRAEQERPSPAKRGVSAITRLTEIRGAKRRKKGSIVARERGYYYTIYVENWKGSYVEHQQETWTFTTHASIATENKLSEETLNKIIDSVGEIAEWIQDELRLLHPALPPTTIGSMFDDERKKSDFTEPVGWIRWEIEDTQVEKVFIGLRQTKFWSVNQIVESIKRNTVLNYFRGTVSARMAR
ncbi:MAG: hypothetical protein ACFFDT_07730 [Candidatus Hodarchaeota archaeon]